MKLGSTLKRGLKPMSNSWDKEKQNNFNILGKRIKWVAENDGNLAHFDIDGVYNLYLDELFIMFEFLQAIGKLRLSSNHTEPE